MIERFGTSELAMGAVRSWFDELKLPSSTEEALRVLDPQALGASAAADQANGTAPSTASHEASVGPPTEEARILKRGKSAKSRFLSLERILKRSRVPAMMSALQLPIRNSPVDDVADSSGSLWSAISRHALASDPRRTARSNRPNDTPSPSSDLAVGAAAAAAAASPSDPAAAAAAAAAAMATLRDASGMRPTESRRTRAGGKIEDLEQPDYFRVQVLVVRALMYHYSTNTVGALIARDWLTDSAGGGVLDETSYSKSLIEIINIWVSGLCGELVDGSAAAVLLRRLLHHVTVQVHVRVEDGIEIERRPPSKEQFECSEPAEWREALRLHRASDALAKRYEADLKEPGKLVGADGRPVRVVYELADIDQVVCMFDRPVSI